MKGTMNKEKRDEYRESLLDPAKQPKFTRHNSDILSLLDQIDELERKVEKYREALQVYGSAKKLMISYNGSMPDPKDKKLGGFASGWNLIEETHVLDNGDTARKALEE